MESGFVNDACNEYPFFFSDYSGVTRRTNKGCVFCHLYEAKDSDVSESDDASLTFSRSELCRSMCQSPFCLSRPQKGEEGPVSTYSPFNPDVASNRQPSSMPTGDVVSNSHDLDDLGQRLDPEEQIRQQSRSERPRQSGYDRAVQQLAAQIEQQLVEQIKEYRQQLNDSHLRQETLKQQLSNRDREIEDRDREIASLTAQFNSLQTEYRTVVSQLQSQQGLTTHQRSQIHALAGQVTDVRAQRQQKIDALQQRIEEIQALRHREKTHLGRQPVLESSPSQQPSTYQVKSQTASIGSTALTFIPKFLWLVLLGIAMVLGTVATFPQAFAVDAAFDVVIYVLKLSFIVVLFSTTSMFAWSLLRK